MGPAVREGAQIGRTETRVLCKNIVMIKVNVFEVKAKLSEYLDRAARGDRIVIYRHNKAVAELRAVEEPSTEPRPIGPLPGRPVFKLEPSFFEPLADNELNLWEGVETAPKASTRRKAAGALPRTRKRRTGRDKTR